MIKLTLTAVAVASLLAACASGPIQRPDPPELPAAFAQGQSLEAGMPTQPQAGFAFGDPVLEALIQRELGANLDLQQAAERVQRSRALANGMRAELSPGGSLGLGARSQQLSRAAAPGANGEDRRGNNASAGAMLSWEIDLFGRLGHAARAADARTTAVDADAAAMRLAVGAEVAQVWFALNGAREQLRLTRTVVENRRETVQLVQRRVTAGYTAPLDEARSRADLAAAEADAPAHEAALALAAHRLAVLLGTSPSTFRAPAASSATPRPVALNIPEPEQWARLRPDLKAAEARLQAQALDVESIRAEFLPRLSVAGVLSFVAGSVSGLGAAGSASWFIAPNVSVPIFDRGRIDARLQAAQAGQREALLAYRQQVLLATEEVESALAQVRQGQLRLAALQDRARHAASAESLARKRFAAGGTDLLELLDAQRNAQQAELGLLSEMTAQKQRLVALQRALGGGFDTTRGAAASAAHESPASDRAHPPSPT